MLENREQQLVDYIKKRGECSSKEIFDKINIVYKVTQLADRGGDNNLQHCWNRTLRS